MVTSIDIKRMLDLEVDSLKQGGLCLQASLILKKLLILINRILKQTMYTKKFSK